jgi:hypothetical protein
MAAVDDLDEVVEQYHLAAREFIKGNPEPYKMVFSHREDVSVANPFGPAPVGGSRSLRQWSALHPRTERASS